jgi:3-hydroxyisobutyrate dehydrogenase-like beta-hydroxyacid dehydrogenase
MAKVTRRGFLQQAAAGTATIGAMMAVPELTDIAEASGPPLKEQAARELAGPVVAHVRNLRTGEIAVMVGTREVVYRDPKFVARLKRAVQ